MSVGPSSTQSTRLPSIASPPSSIVDRRGGADDRARAGSCSRIDVEHRLDALRRGGVHLVHDADVGHAEVRLAGVVAQLVPGAVRVDDDDEEVGPEERRVVVAAVPEDHVGLLLGLREDAPVVDAGEDEVAPRRCAARTPRAPRSCSRRRRGPRSARSAGRLAAPGRRRASGGGGRRPGARRRAGSRDAAGGLALARAGAHRADGDAPASPSGSSVSAGREEPEVGARGERARGEVHHVLVGDVGVGEDDLVDRALADELVELASAWIGMPSG